jgi:hypothetical protein
MGTFLSGATLLDGFDRNSWFFTWPSAGLVIRRMLASGVSLTSLLDGSREIVERLRSSPGSSEPPSAEPMPGAIPVFGGCIGAPLPAGEAAPRVRRGICLAHDHGISSGYLSRRAAGSMRWVRDSLAVNAVAVSPFGYLRSAQESRLFHPGWVRGGVDDGEENDESILAVTEQAHALGLTVMLAPHLWGRDWCGDWCAADDDGWARLFDEYGRFARHYAALAAWSGADLFQVGKELAATTSHEAEWRALIAGVRRIDPGPITYGANWDEYRRIRWWDAVDWIGVSEYTPLSASPDPTLDELRAGARAVADTLDAVSARFGRPWLLTEIGFAGGSGAAREPWSGYDRGNDTVDLELQARCYQAALEVFMARANCGGLYWWKWFTRLESNDQGRNRFDYPPYHKPAGTILAREYRRMQAGEPVVGSIH